VCVHPARGFAEQAAELSRVRCEHAGRGPIARLELGKRIRVDDGRKLELGQEPSDEVVFLVAAAETGTDGKSGRPLGNLVHALERDLHGLE
jgi:hypothetical protein